MSGGTGTHNSHSKKADFYPEKLGVQLLWEAKNLLSLCKHKKL